MTFLRIEIKLTYSDSESKKGHIHRQNQSVKIRLLYVHASTRPQSHGTFSVKMGFIYY